MHKVRLGQAVVCQYSTETGCYATSLRGDYHEAIHGTPQQPMNYWSECVLLSIVGVRWC